MTKTTLPMLLAVLLLVAAGCGGDEQQPATSAETTGETTRDSTAPDPTTPAPTATETTEATETTGAEPKQKPAKPRAIVIVVDQGRPRGGIKRPTIERGEKIVLVVRADAGEEIHVHGYELTRAVTPGRAVRLPITATLAGRFEVELHHPDALLAVLEVRP